MSAAKAQSKRWIVTATGQDRPGIVAGVTEVLYQSGCNLEDSAMTRLAGEFTIMLIVSAPAGLSEDRLSDAFSALGKRLKLAVNVKALSASEARQPARATEPYMISVYGADKPGIVFRMSQALAAERVNITDVQTHRTSGGKSGREPSLYMLLFEVELPKGLTPDGLEKLMKRLAGELGVEVSVSSAEADVL